VLDPVVLDPLLDPDPADVPDPPPLELRPEIVALVRMNPLDEPPVVPDVPVLPVLPVLPDPVLPIDPLAAGMRHPVTVTFSFERFLLFCPAV